MKERMKHIVMSMEYVLYIIFFVIRTETIDYIFIKIIMDLPVKSSSSF